MGRAAAAGADNEPSRLALAAGADRIALTHWKQRLRDGFDLQASLARR